MVWHFSVCQALMLFVAPEVFSMANCEHIVCCNLVLIAWHTPWIEHKHGVKNSSLSDLLGKFWPQEPLDFVCFGHWVCTRSLCEGVSYKRWPIQAGWCHWLVWPPLCLARDGLSWFFVQNNCLSLDLSVCPFVSSFHCLYRSDVSWSKFCILGYSCRLTVFSTKG